MIKVDKETIVIHNNIINNCCIAVDGIHYTDNYITFQNNTFVATPSCKMTIDNYLTHDWSAIADYEKCQQCDIMCYCDGGGEMITDDNSTCAEMIMKQVML